MFPGIVPGGCSLVPLSLTPPTLQKPPEEKHTFSFAFATIFPKTIAELLGIIPQNPREMTIGISEHTAYNCIFIVQIVLYIFLIVLLFCIYVTTTSVQKVFCSEIHKFTTSF